MEILLIISVILISIVFSFLLIVFFVFSILSIVRGAIFVPTQAKKIKRSIDLVNLKPGQRVVDLGSGDGRILIACALRGAEAVGFEINPFLVWKARRNIKKAGLNKPSSDPKNNKGVASCKLKNFWGQNFSSFDVVFVYGINYIMNELEKKLKKELKPQAKVVSFIYKFPNWEIERAENGVYIYKKEG